MENRKITYQEWRKQKQEEFNELPILFAFSMKQLEEGKEKLGVKDNSELVSVYNGAFMKKADVHMLKEHMRKEKQEETGLYKDFDFVYGMFLYELANHEYLYTRDDEETLDACCLEKKDLKNNPMLSDAFEKAKRYYMENC